MYYAFKKYVIQDLQRDKSSNFTFRIFFEGAPCIFLGGGVTT